MGSRSFESSEVAALPPLNALTVTIIGAATQVHTAQAPGVLESAYSACASDHSPVNL